MPKWEGNGDRQLLISIIELTKIKIDDALAQAVSKRLNEDITANAVKHRILKLKELANSSGSSDSPASNPAKKAARKAPRTPKKGTKRMKVEDKGGPSEEEYKEEERNKSKERDDDDDEKCPDY